MNQCSTVPPDALSPTSSTSSPMNISEDTEQDLVDPEPTSKGNIWMEYSSDWLYSPGIGAITINYL